jgi:hypothetical protein
VVAKKMHFQFFQVHKKIENKKQKIKWKKDKRGEKKPKVNLILSHVNHTFLYWTFEMDLKLLDTLIVP